MRRSESISEEIIQTIDIANTLHGGVSEPEVKFQKLPTYHQVEVRVPGISGEDLHVNITENRLVIYYDQRIETHGRMLAIPRIAYNKLIPYFIDATKIRAQFAEGTLTVELPFNERANGNQWDVPIEN